MARPPMPPPSANAARPPSADGELVGEVAELLHTVARRLRRDAWSVLEPLGVTPAQLRALRTLESCGRPVRMSELADRLGVARRSATSVVDELGGRKLVERSDDPTDRRATAVAVIPAGRHLLAAVSRRRVESLATLAGGLSPSQLRQLRNLLRRLA